MPIKTIKFTGLEWGMDVFVKNDPEQLPHHLVGLLILPGGGVKFQLQAYIDLDPMFKYDFECEFKPGEVKEIEEVDEED